MTPLVIQVTDDQTGQVERNAFIDSPVRIGRSELNDLALPQPFVSTWHAWVQFDDKGISYTDVGSTNGSFLEGVRLEKGQATPITADSVVRIGSLQLTFRPQAAVDNVGPERRETVFSRKVTALGTSAKDLVGDAVRGMVEASIPKAYVPDAAVAEEAEAVIARGGLDLDMAYASYRGTWEHLRSSFEEMIRPLGLETRRVVMQRLAERFADATHEPGFIDMGRELQIPPEDLGVSSPTPVEARGPQAPPLSLPGIPQRVGGDVLDLLRRFGESYLPAKVSLDRSQDVETLLSRVAEVLETFARSYVELRRGFDEFGKEMGIRGARSEGRAQRAGDGRQLLALLLDPSVESASREVERTFADFMLHQVALLRGVVRGAQDMLDRLNPEEIERQTPKELLTVRAVALWRAYQDRFHDLADEENAVSDSLFGKAFARAYLGILGESHGVSGEDGGERASPAHGTPVDERRGRDRS